jgi:WD40 repeat protein
VWDLVDCDLLTDTRTYYGPIFDLQPAGDGSRAISGSDEGALKIWDPRTGHSIEELISQSEDIRAVAVSADGARALSGSQDGVLEHWDLNNGVLLHSWKGHDSAVRAVSILDNSKQSISVSSDRTLRVWDLVGYTERFCLRTDSEISDVAVLSDGRRVIYTSEGYTLNIWDLITGQELVEYKARSPIQVFAVSPNEQHVVFAGCLPRTMISRNLRVGQASEEELLNLYALTIWDMVSQEALFKLEGHLDQVTGVVFLDQHRVVSSSFDGTIKAWDLGTRQVIASFQCDYSPLCCTVTPYQRTVIAGDEGGNLHVLRLVEQAQNDQNRFLSNRT